ncbi:DMT family transporter [Streptomyces sp. TS71-3]|uniref:DMT family transporter n=1 Tax=Streptomyces sp. TS71-3 TaxID=2733862 RepID=UPI001B0DFAFE|nr:DMT family transporter [Streptomyces sp. TS71-3]GHJ37990.1 membrane protein [Streptomyces sp. TS71-3]
MTARAWSLFALMSVLWGIPYLMIKVAVEGISPSGVVFARCALGAALLLPFALRQGGLARVLRTHWRPMAAFACTEIIVPWWTLTDAERRLSSSTAGLLIAAVPILGVALARLFGERERLGARRLTGLGLGLAGVAVLTAPHLTVADARSLAEVLVTIVGYAVAPLIVARHLKPVPTLQLIAPCLTLAAVVYAPAALLDRPATAPGAAVWASLAGLGVICTAVAFVGFLELIREAGPTRAVVFTYVNPAVAVAAGVAFLDEPLTAGVLAAFALILLGSVLATATAGRRRGSTVAASGPLGSGGAPAVAASGTPPVTAPAAPRSPRSEDVDRHGG